MDNDDAGTVFENIARLLVLGYDPDRALATTVLRHTLLQGTSKLRELGPTAADPAAPTDIVIGTGPDAIPGGLLIRDDLLPLWKDFAETLCHFAAHEHEHRNLMNLVVQNVGLPGEVLDILEPALKTAPLNVLGFSTNGLGSDGEKFVVRLLEANPSIRNLSLEGNEIECGPETLSLLEAARNHAGLRVLDLDQCGVGGKLSASPGIVPALLRLRSVHLAGNGIGSHGAKLISNCLATNPEIKQLYLYNNMLDDEDAILFASALETNRNLLHLSLHGNNFTDAGIKTLYKSIYDDQSLNSIHHSNHTCWLELLADGQPAPTGIYTEVLSLNGKRIDASSVPNSAMKRFAKGTLKDWAIASSAKGTSRDWAIASRVLFRHARKRIKILVALRGGGGSDFDSRYLKEVPTKLIPRVLESLQESCTYAGAEEGSLDSLFQVVSSRPVDFCVRPPEETSLCEVHRTDMWSRSSFSARKLLDLFILRLWEHLFKAKIMRSVAPEKTVYVKK